MPPVRRVVTGDGATTHVHLHDVIWALPLLVPRAPVPWLRGRRLTPGQLARLRDDRAHAFNVRMDVLYACVTAANSGLPVASAPAEPWVPTKGLCAWLAKHAPRGCRDRRDRHHVRAVLQRRVIGAWLDTLDASPPPIGTHSLDASGHGPAASRAPSH